MKMSVNFSIWQYTKETLLKSRLICDVFLIAVNLNVDKSFKIYTQNNIQASS